MSAEARGGDEKLPRLVKIQLGVAVVATLVVILAAIGVGKLVRQRDRLQRDLATLENRADELAQEIEEKQDQLADVEEALEYVQAQLAQGEVELAEQRLATRERQPTAAEIKPRVYLHLTSERQRPRVPRIAKALERGDFRVPPEQIVELTISRNQVRYFRPAEEKEARRVAEVLESCDIGEVWVRFLPGYEESNAIRPRHYEVYLRNPGS